MSKTDTDVELDVRGGRRVDLSKLSTEKFNSMVTHAWEAGKLKGYEAGKALEAEVMALGPRERAKKIKELSRESRLKNHELAEVERRIERLRGIIATHESLVALVAVTGLRLERANSSVAHQLHQSIHDGALFIGGDKDSLSKRMSASRIKEYDELFTVAQSFVVQHDWAAAFKNATDYAEFGKFKLPYEVCAFEFRVSGRPVIVLATEADTVVYVQLAVEANGSWFSFEHAMPFDDCLEGFGDPGFPEIALMVFLAPQIKAIAVALDAEVAETDVVRAPERLNRARAKAARRPLKDYHVVSLSSRARAKSLASTGQSGTRRRLHFRRGHWRHFETFKTWVRWTLVGDPDLGFVDKEYRL